jgi:glycosyltransferase involved in cell wall biosynthesis
MKVLYIVDEPEAFEEGSATQSRLKELAQAIGELHVLTPMPSNFFGPHEKKDGSLSLYAARSEKLFFVRRLSSYANRIILKEGIEVVSAQDPFEYGQAAAEAVKGTNAKLHIQIHTDFLSPWFIRSHITRSPQTRVSPQNKKRLQIAASVLPQAKGIRVVSKRIQDSLIATYKDSIVSSHIIPPYISKNPPPPVQLPFHQFKFVFITFGRLEPEKRIEDILVAFARLKDHYSSIGLMIVGEGREERRLKHWAEVLGISSQVIFLGERSDIEAWGLLQNAHAYIQACAYEGYGRGLVEAALSNIPIITTDVGIVGEVFTGMENVLATPPGDPTNLSVHISRMVEDVTLRKELVMNAFKAVQNHLDSVHSSPDDIAKDLQATLS